MNGEKMKITKKQLRQLIMEAVFVHGSTIPDRLGLKLPHDTSGINYTALVLDEQSHQALLQYVPNGWQPFCHHVTLIAPTRQKGQRIPEYYLNQEASVVIDSIVMDEKVIAGVVNINLSDPLPVDGPTFLHCTIATNPALKGKPFMSNNLDVNNSQSIQPIYLSGTIQELIK
jgi:hypothetical protein